MHSRANFIKVALFILIFLALMIVGLTFYKYSQTYKSTLISRKELFSISDNDRASVSISHDGKWISYIAAKNGVWNVWVQDISTGKTRAITNEKERGIWIYQWAYDNKHILYQKDEAGNENWQIYKVNLENGVSTLLTPKTGVHAKIMKQSYLYPNKVVVGLNDRDPVYHDLYEIDLETGKKRVLFKNTEFDTFLINDELKIVLASKINKKGETEYYLPKSQGKWAFHRKVSLEDAVTTSPLAVDSSNQWIYWLDSEGSDKSNLVKINVKNKKKITITRGNKADLIDVIFHPLTKEPFIVNEEYFRKVSLPLTPEVEKDLKILRSADPGELDILSFSSDCKKWIVYFLDDDKPGRYYLYDRITKEIKFLFYNKSKLLNKPLVKMRPIEIKSRDGLTLVSYLSLPLDAKTGVPMPMVLRVHGGPIARDEWGLDSYHQWLANRGYAVLSVNYRSSTGFGKNFIKASYGEYGRKMHDDLIDGVNWAIQEKIADPKKIAIYGGSYGGYATLVGATMTPYVFACAIDCFGMSSLITSCFAENMPAYWKTSYEFYKKTIGADPYTEEGKAFLHSRSPIAYVDNIKNPLLIMQGLNDPIVLKMESDQMVEIMKKKNIPVTYVLFPDEGHGFMRPVNRLAEIAVAEMFLHQNLGGSLEPVAEEIKNSSMQVLEGNIKN